jgi:hypothetical protein
MIVMCRWYEALRAEATPPLTYGSVPGFQASMNEAGYLVGR